MADAPGFYGKAVTRGDFLSRRLPAGFAAAWDGWLQTMLSAAHAKLGEAWRDAFVTMPVWHFALGSGIAGPTAALGVLIPSVDRVGRYFPFTIMGFCAPAGLATVPWTASAERLALAALEDDFDPETLDAALSTLGPPCSPASAALPPLGWSAASETRPAPAMRESLWWCRGTARIPAAMLRTENLPNATEAAWLIAGTQ
jgi:type VI secretion system protein ImpM